MTDLLDTVAPPLPEETAEGSARAAVTPRDAWRKARVPVLIGLLLVLVAVGQALTTGGISDGYLDARAAKPAGGRALAVLLGNHGVDVRVVDEPTGGPDTTVFVPVPDLLRSETLPTDGDLVVADPLGGLAETLVPGLSVRGDDDPRSTPAGCDQADAVAAGSVRMGGLRFSAPATRCYRDHFVESGHVTLLGDGEFMTNEHLDEDGNAALALRLLTRHPTLEWVYPKPLPVADGGGESVADLIPHNVKAFQRELYVVALFLALWRVRRLGPVVSEPLPVVVRAAETVEGRARLYESAHARERAATALRAGLRDRLVRVLGLAPDAPREALVDTVSSRTGRDGMEVDDVLYGNPPTDDAALVRLAGELDRLSNEVRDL